MNNKNRVSYEEQKEQGLIRQQRQTFVPAPPKQEVLPPMQAPPSYQADFNLNIPPSATQHVELRTSATDRAKGFAIETRELGLVFSLSFCFAAWLLADVPIFSGWMLALFLGMYSIVWCFAYYQHKHTSAEGVSLYEAKGKVEIVKTIVNAQVRQFELDREQARKERAEDRARRLQ
jgi:hypothetical protein